MVGYNIWQMAADFNNITIVFVKVNDYRNQFETWAKTKP